LGISFADMTELSGGAGFEHVVEIPNLGVTGYPLPVQAAGGALPAFSAAGGTNSLVSVDAIQEFRIQTSSFADWHSIVPLSLAALWDFHCERKTTIIRSPSPDA
jgi:hypothetical protein